jgi:hypothetical protein
VHHIDRHELQIDSVSLSTTAGIAVTVTRRFSKQNSDPELAKPRPKRARLSKA